MKRESQFTAATAIALAACLLFWSSAFPVIRVCVQHFGAGELALGRFLTASLAVAIVMAFARPHLPDRRDIPWFLALGVTGYVIYHVCLNYGETVVTAGAASFLINTSPVWAALFAVAFLGERLSRIGWAGVLVSFGGVALIAVAGEGELSFRPEAMLILVAAVSSAVYVVLQKKMLDRYRALELTAYSMWSGTLLMLWWTPGLVEQVQTSPASATAGMVYLGIFPGALSYVLYARVLSVLPAAQTISFLYLIPPLTVVISWQWLGEVPAAQALLGGVLALAGVALVNWRGHMKQRSNEPEA